MSLSRFFNKLTASFKSQAPTAEDDSPTQEQEIPASSPDQNIGKIKSIIAEVTEAFPLFERAGFHVEELQVEVAVSSKLIPRFRVVREASEEEQAAFLAEVADKRLIQFMLISLFKATKMKNLIQDPMLQLCAIEIDLNDKPAVRAIYRSAPDTSNVIRLNTTD
ncbi:hypothetical protein [Pleionea sp. CnH1-48]|uniref:hypothetical protein n=1 Tax=Pleionea sp. CnH1-48 TaxID=2954494 RepID=UPI00209713C3|nr:hypothetical protein [Pleionea sp. CnH1-48]MCO7224846.1 hypothetical protein [Pleionea sp. CnH1-48]